MPDGLELFASSFCGPHRLFLTGIEWLEGEDGRVLKANGLANTAPCNIVNTLQLAIPVAVFAVRH